VLKKTFPGLFSSKCLKRSFCRSPFFKRLRLLKYDGTAAYRLARLPQKVNRQPVSPNSPGLAQFRVYFQLLLINLFGFTIDRILIFDPFSLRGIITRQLGG